MIEKNKGNSKSTWSLLKELLPKSANSAITSIKSNGTLVTDFKDICNTLNSYFVNVSLDLARSIRNVSITPREYLQKYLPNVTCTFKFKDVSNTEMLKLINGIPSGKATGLDNIQVRLLKTCATEIVDSLTYLVNLSLHSGKFPKDWKLAKITPIHKKGAKTDPGNYRPVSVLPVISKFIERIVPINSTNT
jgi:hypothetical protein